MNAAQARDITDRVIKERESKVYLKEVYEGIKMLAAKGYSRYWTIRRLTPSEIKELEKNGYKIEEENGYINNYYKIYW